MSMYLPSSLNLEMRLYLTYGLQPHENPEPEDPSRLLTHRYCEITNVCCFKLLNSGIICHVPIGTLELIN